MKNLFYRRFEIHNLMPPACLICLLSLVPYAWHGGIVLLKAGNIKSSAVDASDFTAPRRKDLMAPLLKPKATNPKTQQREDRVLSTSRAVYRSIFSESNEPLPALSFGYHPAMLHDGSSGDTRTGFAGRVWQKEAAYITCLLDLGSAPMRCSELNIRFAQRGSGATSTLYGSKDGITWSTIADLGDGSNELSPLLPAFRFFQVIVGAAATRKWEMKECVITDLRLYDNDGALVKGTRRWI